VIRIYGFGGESPLVSVSPFCEKVAVYMRLRGLEYEYTETDPRGSPKGKVPYLETDMLDEANEAGPTTMYDSQRIIDAFEEVGENPLDDGLSDAGRHRGHVMRRTLEEGFYFCLLAMRWLDDDGWSRMKPQVAAMAPRLLRGILPPIARRMVRKQLWAQGTARHDVDDIVEMGRADLEAVAATIGSHDFALGKYPRSVDASIYAFVANPLWGPRTPFTDVVRNNDTLLAYCERVRERISDAPDDLAG